MNNIAEAERALNYTFKDKNLLKRALTVASASENNNQLLEFFGDAILEFIVSERLGLDILLIRGKKDFNNKKAVPSAYEAVTAAIYLDGGMDAAKKFVYSTLDFSAAATVINYKGRLQELMQGAGKPVPEYIRTDIGNAQKHRFSVKIKLYGKTVRGEADSVKKAEQNAAEKALQYIESKGLK